MIRSVSTSTKLLTMALAFGFSTFAKAGLLKEIPSGKKLNGVSIAKSATANVSNGHSELTLLGAGTRTKSIFNKKIYVAQLLGDNPEAFVRSLEGALPSTKSFSTLSLKMSMLYALDANALASSFEKALKVNDVNLQEPSIRETLTVLSGLKDLSVGDKLILLFERLSDGSERVSLESPTGQVIQINAGAEANLITKLLSIWIGKHADDGLEQLKSEIILGGNL